jgi:molecular chaperone DnaK (HSP70)
VAKGAAVYGQKKELERHVLDDLVAQGKLAEGAGLDAADSEDLDKALAGAAGDYGLATGAVADLVRTRMTNVTSRGFGIFAEDRGKPVAAFLAHQNDALPIQVSRTFYTISDDQAKVDIRVFEQGSAAESTALGDNKVIVEGAIAGIKPGHPRGTRVDVTFSMRTDQTIEVTATHPGTTDPLVLTVSAGVGSEAMRDAERAKVNLLKQRT